MSLTLAPAALTEAHRSHNPYFRIIVSIRGTIRQRAVIEVLDQRNEVEDGRKNGKRKDYWSVLIASDP
jgi:hypothetical protein